MMDVALITGAAGGIGATVARLVAETGMAVAVCDLNLESAEAVASEVRDVGGVAAAIEIDVTNEVSVKEAFDLAQRELGLVNRLVTAAGVISKVPFAELELDAWSRTLAVNLTGTWLTIRDAARRLDRANASGTFVGISSAAGRGPRATAADYAASKAGVISVCQSAAVALAPRIRVNCVCPGVVDTQMTQAIHEQNAAELDITVEESIAQAVSTIPMGREVSTDEVAHIIQWLLSEHSAYVTGQAVNICGGLEFN